MLARPNDYALAAVQVGLCAVAHAHVERALAVARAHAHVSTT